MKLHVTIDGRPAIIVGYGPGKNGTPKAICITENFNTLVAVELGDCILPKIPRKLQRRIRTLVRAETRNAQHELGKPEIRKLES